MLLEFDSQHINAINRIEKTTLIVDSLNKIKYKKDAGQPCID